jgi:hypothetical protein
MLTDRITNTKDVMKRSKIAQEKIDQHQKFQDFIDTVLREKNRMMEIIQAISTLNKYDEFRFPKAELDQILWKVKDTLESFEAEPKKGKLQYLTRELEEKGRVYKEKWNSFATSAMEEATRTLNSIHGLVENKQEIEDIIESMQRISQLWPVSEKNVTYFDKMLKEAKSKVTRLQVSPSIQQFLEKVANDEASLSDITPEISEWLTQQDFSKNLIISFKRGL